MSKIRSFIFTCAVMLIFGTNIAFAVYFTPVDQLANNKLLILSFPRSGRSIITAIIRNYIFEYYPEEASTDFFQDAVHDSTKLEAFNDGEHKLIFILRNPRECLCRHFGCNKFKMNKEIRAFGKNIQMLINNISFFEKWSPKNKILIYYEDFLLNPIEALTNVVEFLGFDTSNVEAFLNSNLNEIKKNALSTYIYSQGSSSSKGLSILHHTNHLPLSTNRMLNLVFKKKIPFLWNKYLTRFDLK